MIYQANRTIKVEGARILKGDEVEVYRAISPSTLVKLYEVITSSGYSFKLAESTLNKFFN